MRPTMPEPTGAAGDAAEPSFRRISTGSPQIDYVPMAKRT